MGVHQKAVKSKDALEERKLKHKIRRMIKCLLANNDSVVDKLLSESVLELEYLDKNVLTDNDRWIESTIVGNFKIWHVALLTCAGTLALLSIICALVNVRIPRTKSEIEA